MGASTHGNGMGALVHCNVLANSWLPTGLYTEPWVPMCVLYGPFDSLFVHWCICNVQVELRFMVWLYVMFGYVYL